MTETTRAVFEKHEVRKTRRQKTAFIEYVKNTAEERGYGCCVEKGYFGARNIVVGDPDRAKVIYTAHYDTCARLPFPNFITPKCIWLYLLYQLVISAALLGVPVLVVMVIGWLGLLLSPYLTVGIMVGFGGAVFLWYLLLLLEMYLIMAGPANKHTANDNTSGVTTLLDIMTLLPEELRGEVAFVFFDLEEMGLFGSAGFAGKHKSVMQNTLLINFDCVSDGHTMLFALRKGAERYEHAIREAFPSTDALQVEVVSKGVFYPSDQANFKRGVGVAALKGKGRLLYMDRIHTSKDTVYEEGNIACLAEGAVRLARNLIENK